MAVLQKSRLARACPVLPQPEQHSCPGVPPPGLSAVAAAFRLEGSALLTAAEAFGPLPGGAFPPPASRMAVTAGAAPATPPMAGGHAEAAVSAAAQRAAGYERVEGPEGAAAAGPGQRVVAAHRRDSSGGLYPGTPAAQPPVPPMARFPVTESQHGEGVGFSAKV